MTPGPLLTARDLTVHRGTTPVIGGISLTVHQGEVLALVGPNGAGKSTVLGALAGSVAYRGSISLGDHDLQSLSAREQSRARAVLPQSHSVGFGFTCREIIEMSRFAWHGTSRRHDDEAAISAAIEACAVQQFLDRRFTELSGGERARVALARVLAQDTALILLDEPTAAMDLHYQEAVMAIVAERARSGVGVVVVVHDLSLAAAWADRVAVLCDGQIVADGPPAEALTDELLSRVYRIPITVRTVDKALMIGPDRTEAQVRRRETSSDEHNPHR